MNKKLASIVLSLLALYLLVSFVASLILSSVNITGKSIEGDEIARYAQNFLVDPNLIKLGKKLDCSGFTKKVYADLGVSIPVNSTGQYSLVEADDSIAVKGDLIFFAIHSSQVNHVGILLSDSTFIHSPGRNKEVRLESLNVGYWRRFYKGSANVK